MLKSKYDFGKRLLYVSYGRMSTGMQNPTSPDQQFDEIERTIRQQGRTWVCVGSFRDDGVSGKLLRQRPGFSEMLRKIRSGELKVDLILVDSAERFGRHDDIPAIRRELLNRYGALLLTADSKFVDPTTQAGRAVGLVEQIRSTSGNEIKAHEVLRGKRKVAEQRHWPGGPAPFGMRLRSVADTARGPLKYYSVLEPDPETSFIVVKCLNLARDTGWGRARITKALNADPEIPNKFKPLIESSIGAILANPICVGDYHFNKVCVGIVDDARVVQKNDVSEILVIKDFCTPIYPREDWEKIQALRSLRSQKDKMARKAKAAARLSAAGGNFSEKQIAPIAPGLSVKNPLSGLIFCAECNARMILSSSVGANVHGKSLYYYRCPSSTGGACVHKSYVRADKLLDAVVCSLRSKLFPLPPAGTDGSPLPAPPWLLQLMNDIRQELASLQAQTPDQRPQLQEEMRQINLRMSGWMLSLSKIDLQQSVRYALEGQFAQASAELNAVQQQLAALESNVRKSELVLDAETAMKRLQRLDQILSAGNNTAANVELSLHIDRIEVSNDGRVVMHTSKLGIFEGAAQLLGGDSVSPLQQSPSSSDQVQHRVVSRRRTRAALADPDLEVSFSDAEKSAVMDTHRFAGLDPKWFWREDFKIAPELSWSAEHAQAVAAKWAEDPRQWTMPRLAEHFHVSIPTARKALRLGQKAAGIEAPRREIAPRGIENFREIADESAALYLGNPPMDIRAIAKRFNVNQVTISKALDHWYTQRGLERPDGRAARKGRLYPAGNDVIPGPAGGEMGLATPAA